MPSHQKPIKVAVIGGGTGTFPVISALKSLGASISSIIVVSDSGGSTGRIRDELGFQPVGDLRQALAALAESEGEEWIRKILLYRFEKGTQFRGHNLGNLILTALQDMTGSTTQALEIAEKVFRIEGSVIPVTEDNVHLEIHYQDGTTVIGEHTLDEHTENPKTIDHVALTPRARLNPVARQALLDADYIVIGPGDYYASIMGVLVVEEIQEVLSKVSAPIMYILNLMTRWTQTKDMTARMHLDGIEAALGKKVDSMLVHQGVFSPATLAMYQHEHEYPIVDDMGDDPRVIRAEVSSDTLIQKSAVDTAHRSLLRHDTQKLKQVFSKLLNDLGH